MGLIAMIVGYFVIGIILLLVVISSIEIRFKPDFVFAVFRFGFIWARKEETIHRLNKFAKTTNRKFFISFPYWFNRYIWNVGGVKNDVDQEGK